MTDSHRLSFYHLYDTPAETVYTLTAFENQYVEGAFGSIERDKAFSRDNITLHTKEMQLILQAHRGEDHNPY